MSDLFDELDFEIDDIVDGTASIVESLSEDPLESLSEDPLESLLGDFFTEQYEASTAIFTKLEEISIDDPFLLDELEIQESNTELSQPLNLSYPPISIDNSLSSIADSYMNLIQSLKSIKTKSDYSNDRIRKNMSDYYKNNNPGIPTIRITVDNETIPLDMLLIDYIRKRINVLEIVDKLKSIFQNINVKAGSSTYRVSGERESDIIEFLNNFKSYYEAAFSESDDLLLTHNNLRTEIMLYCYEQSNPLNKTGISEITSYPRSILLEKSSYVCGNCGSINIYEYPFFRCLLTNLGREDDFLTIFPTTELCVSCHHLNIMPQNYKALIEEKLKIMFAEDTSISELKADYNSLSKSFSFQLYTLPYAAIRESAGNKLSFYFPLPDIDVFDIVEEVIVHELDVESAIAKYKLLTTQPVVDFTSNIEVDSVVNEHGDISDELMNNSRPFLTKMFCSILSMDYASIKENAVSSLIYTLNDHIPYTINPYHIASLKADFLLGLVEETTYLDTLDTYNRALDSLIATRQYYSFIPVSTSIPAHENLYQYVIDPRFKSFIDYVSDMMILNYFADDIIILLDLGASAKFNEQIRTSTGSIIGNLPSSAPPKITKSALFKNVNQLSSNMVKFCRSLNLQDNNVLNFSMVVNKFLSYSWVGEIGKQYNTIMRPFSNKDIYTLYHSLDKKLEHLPDLQPLFRELSPYKDDILDKTALQYYYGEYFSNEELNSLNSGDIRVFFDKTPEENQTAADFIKDIRSLKFSKLSRDTIKHNKFFNDNVDWFFYIFSRFLLDKVPIENILILDILKYSAGYSLRDAAQFFGVSESLLKTYLITASVFEFPETDEELYIAKMILANYEYKDADLQIITSERADEDLDTIYAALFSHSDTLFEEFSEATQEIKDILIRKIPSIFGSGQ